MRKLIKLLICLLPFTAYSQVVDRAQVISDIDNNIYTNATHQITAVKLNFVLKEIANSYLNGISDANGTINFTPIWTGMHTLANGFTYQKGRSFVVPVNRYLSGDDTTKSQIDFKHLGVAGYGYFSADKGQGNQGMFSFSSSSSFLGFNPSGGNASYFNAINGINQVIADSIILQARDNAVQINIASKGAGKILQSDGSGYVTWVTPASGITGLTTNTIPVATSATTLGDSYLSQTAFGVFVQAGQYLVSDIFRVGRPSSTTGSLKFYNATNANAITINAGTTSGAYTLLLPTAQGGASTVLQNDGSGVLSWATPASPISGLTTNYLPIATSGSTIGNSPVYKYYSTIVLPSTYRLTNEHVGGGFFESGGYGLGRSSVGMIADTALKTGLINADSTTAAISYNILNGSHYTRIGCNKNIVQIRGDSVYIDAYGANGGIEIGTTSAKYITLGNGQTIRMNGDTIFASGRLVSTALRYADGNQATGKVLTSNAYGIASWQTPTSYLAGYGMGLTGSTFKVDTTVIASKAYAGLHLGTVTSVSGTTNRITSTGGATPVIDISASYVGQSSITTLGTITTGTLGSGSKILVGSDATGDIYYNGGSGTITRLAKGSTGTRLKIVAGLPSWSAPTTIDTVGTITSGTWSATNITLAKGGTSASLTADNGGIFYSTASAGAILASTATANKMLLSGASTTPTWSTSTIPTSAGATANKVVLSDGTNYVLSTPTFPNASATSGKRIKSDGTNWIASTTTMPDAGTSGKIIIGDGTNYVESTPTYPNASATSGKLIISDGTNYVASTPTFPNASATSGKVITSDGTNWIASTTLFPNSATIGDIPQATSTSTYTNLAGVAAGSYLRSGGVATANVWSTLILPNSATVNQLAYATATNTWGGNSLLTFDGTIFTANALTSNASGFAFGGNASSTIPILANTSTNQGNMIRCINTSTGNSAYGGFMMTSNGSSNRLIAIGTNYSAGAGNAYIAGSLLLEAEGTQGLNLATETVSPIRFYINDVDKWDILSTGHLVATTDNTTDLGASGATRPRTIYVGTSVVTPFLNATGQSTTVAPIKITSGTVKTTAATGEIEYDGTSLFFTNSGLQRQQLPQIQESRVSTQFDATTNTTLANITGLTATLVAGKTYDFEATLHLTADAVGGGKFAIAGTATATSIIYQVIEIDNTSNLNTITSRQTALAGSIGQAGTTSGFIKIKGVITVNGAGTLTVQFAENASNLTSSILVGSTFIVRQIP